MTIDNLYLIFYVKKKKSAHQRHRETLEAGEWSSGRKWADDSPLEMVYSETVTFINTGACGAFIHGLEDEFSGIVTRLFFSGFFNCVIITL